MNEKHEFTDKELENAEFDSFTMLTDAIQNGEVKVKSDASKSK